MNCFNKYTLILLLASLIALAGPASYEASDTASGYADLLRNRRSANESLLKKFRAQADALKNDLETNPGEETKLSLTDLEYKIHTIEENNKRLESSIANHEKANIFLKEFIATKLDSNDTKDNLPSIPPAETDKIPPESLATPPPAPSAETKEVLLEDELPSSASQDKTTSSIIQQQPLTKRKASQEVRKRNKALFDQKKMHEKGLKLVAENKIREAKKLYENIIFTNPSDAQAYIILGHIYILSAEYDKAELAFSNAVDIDPANIHDITPFYENMILKDPDDDLAHTYLGYAYLILGNFLKARESFERALDINAANKEAKQGYEITQR